MDFDNNGIYGSNKSNNDNFHTKWTKHEYQADYVQ